MLKNIPKNAERTGASAIKGLFECGSLVGVYARDTLSLFLTLTHAWHKYHAHVHNVYAQSRNARIFTHLRLYTQKVKYRAICLMLGYDCCRSMLCLTA